MNAKNTDQLKWPSELDSLDRPPAQRVPRAERNQVMWSWVAVIAMVFVLGMTFYAIDARQDQRTASQSQPISATPPSLASGDRPSPPATAGQAPAAETAGQGASSDDRRSGDEAER